MKKIFLLLLLAVCTTAATAALPSDEKAAAVPEEKAQSVPLKKKVFMQVGAVESVENGRYLMRKTETRYEFYLDENTSIFLRTEGSAAELQDGNYLVIKGPKNKKVVLANSIYIYESKEAYEKTLDKKEETSEGAKKVFSALVEGYIRQKHPLMVRQDDTSDYMVSFDEDTYWVMTKPADKSEIKAGERIKIFFDKVYSIRYKNYPIRVIIDRVKAGF